MKTLFSDFLLEDFALSSGHRTCLSTLVTVGSYCLPGLSPISGRNLAITTGMDAWNTSNDGRKPPALTGTQIQPSTVASSLPLPHWNPSPRPLSSFGGLNAAKGEGNCCRSLENEENDHFKPSKVPKWSKVVSEKDWTPGFSLPSLLLPY